MHADCPKSTYLCAMNQNQLPFEFISVQDVVSMLEQHGHVLSLMDTCGFFLCQNGWVEVSINEQAFRVQANDIYFYMPSTFMSVLSSSDDLAGLAVKCEASFVLPLLERLLDGVNIVAIREQPCFTLTREQRQTLENLTMMVSERKRLVLSMSESNPSYVILQRLVLSLAESLFHEFIYIYSTNRKVRTQNHDTQDRIFQTFLASLFVNYKREREVSYYAAEQCLSARYFSSVVKEKSGRTALQWIIQMVISSAKQALRSTDDSIKQIATDFNFPSQSFFGKYFKQYVGISPKNYRNQARKKQKKS